MPRFAANLSMMFGEVAFLERFAAARAAGFDAAEFLFPYEHPPETVAEAAEKAGISVVLFNMPPGDWAAGERGMAAFPGRRAEFAEGLEKALRYAAALRVPRLHAMAGIAPAKDETARTSYLDALKLAADKAGEAGLDVLIEPINPRDMPGYFLNDFDLAAEIIAALGRPNLKLQFDIYHRQVMRGDVIEGLKAFLPITGHVQIASVPRRNEPGTGELDDFRIFETLDALGYQGHVGCEYRPAGATLDGLSWLGRVEGR